MAQWTIDQAHTEIGFKVKHLMISTVKGYFKTFSGAVTASDDSFANAAISFEADAGSISTNSEQRDGHLRAADFFHVAEFPKITFTSHSFTKTDGNNFKLTGTLTMRGVAKEVTLDTTFNGINTSPVDGKRVASFDIKGVINRHDFGLTWNVALETGGVLVGDEVKLDLTVELKEA